MRSIYTNHPSPNYDARPDGVAPDILVLHYTGMPSFEAAITRLTQVESRVSAHYVVDEDGAIYKLVDEQYRAWHAGVSYWRGREAINDVSIGIEIVNPGHEFGYRPFPKLQMQAVRELSLDIVTRYNIEPRNVVGHSDIAPSRKEDPGELFDWKYLAEKGVSQRTVGLWVEPSRGTGTEALWGIGATGARIRQLQANLAEYGYNIKEDGVYGAKTEYVVTAFQRHFCQDQVDGVWNRYNDAVLKQLLLAAESSAITRSSQTAG